MEEEPRGSRPWDEELPPAETASLHDLAQTLRSLGDFASSLEQPAPSEQETAEQARRIHHLADWIRAATAALMTPAGDLPTALETWGDPEPGELSHAMLVATLMHKGGSCVLPSSAMISDALSGRDGALHAVALEPLPDGFIRLSVCPRPDTDGAGTAYTSP
ncbi:hypothetical protein ACQEU8_04110 [Streptomyces sp. CA-250714]|uniref:hypothetical protein n=1 Tax=Streptomyces sp. CA-250714 TaxID=3240060 RepID=UPI003D8A8808